MNLFCLHPLVQKSKYNLSKIFSTASILISKINIYYIQKIDKNKTDSYCQADNGKYTT